MFSIPQHVRDEAIEAMRVALIEAGVSPDALTLERAGAAFDAAVELVMKRMGLSV